MYSVVWRFSKPLQNIFAMYWGHFDPDKNGERALRQRGDRQPSEEG